MSKYYVIIYFFALCSILWSTTCFGYQTDSLIPNAITEMVIEDNDLPWSDRDIILSLSVLIFGFCIILVESWIIYKKNSNTDGAFKYISITLIVVSTLFLLTAGFSNSQITPIIGLFGTIAGYILGRINNENKDE